MNVYRTRPISDQAQHLLMCSASEAKRLLQVPSAVHVLMSVSIAQTTTADYIIKKLGVDCTALRNVLELSCDNDSVPLDSITAQAQRNAERFGCPFVDTEHVLLSALQLGGTGVNKAFDAFGIPINEAIARTEAFIKEIT